MGVRNYEELGKVLQKICARLFANDNLLKLLYYTDQDPYAQPTLTELQKEDLFGDLVTVVPRLGTREDDKSAIAVYVPQTSRIGANKEFQNTTVAIEVAVPLHQWVVNDINFRPFLIMGEISQSLEGKDVNGLGRLEGNGFDLILVTDEISIYRMDFLVTAYE